MSLEVKTLAPTTRTLGHQNGHICGHKHSAYMNLGLNGAVEGRGGNRDVQRAWRAIDGMVMGKLLLQH